jgi:putative transposase
VEEYHRCRFQTKFNFRDAKQFWGLEKFMNASQAAVTNVTNLSLLMVNLSQVLMSEF